MNTSPLGFVANTHKGIILRLGRREKGGGGESDSHLPGQKTHGVDRRYKGPKVQLDGEKWSYTLMFWALCLSFPFALLLCRSVCDPQNWERWKRECPPCSFPRRTHPTAHLLTLWLTTELRWATWSTHHLWHYQSEGCAHSWCVLHTEQMCSLWDLGPGNGHLLIQRPHTYSEEACDWGSLKYYSPVAPWCWRQCLALGY